MRRTRYLIAGLAALSLALPAASSTAANTIAIGTASELAALASLAGAVRS